MCRFSSVKFGHCDHAHALVETFSLTIGGVDSTGFNVGAIYDFNAHSHLLFSAGRGFQNADNTNVFSWYVG